MAAGTSFEIDVAVKAAQAVQAADVLASLETRLKAAGDASSAAAQAVKAGEAAYKSATSAAENAAKAVEKIGLMADAQKGKLEAAMKAGDEKAFWRAAQAIQDLNTKQAEAAVKAGAAKTALDAATTSLDALRASAVSAADAQVALGTEAEAASAKAAAAAKAVTAAEKNQQAAFEATRKALVASQREMGEAIAARVDASMKAEAKGAAEAKKAADAAAGTGKANEAAEAFGKLGGPVGALGTKVFGLKEGWNKMKATFGDKAPMVLAAAGALALTLAIVAVGVAAVVAIAKFGAWSVTLADNARSQGLLAAGIARTAAGGELLNSKISSLANTLPLTSDELRSMASNLANTGLRGEALSTALQDAALKAAKLKYGPEFGKQMVSLEQLSKRLTMGVTGIFGGLKIEGLLEKLSSLVDLFEENGATANAIKVVFESFFQPAIDGVEGFIPKFVSAFIQLQIWALQGLIAIKPYGFVFRDAATAAGIMGSQIQLAFGVLAFLAVGAATQLLFMLSIVKTWRDNIIAVGTAVTNLGATITAIDLGQVGRDMMTGLANGITSGASAVVDAMKNAATGAVKAAKGALGINSPSRVLAAEVGQHIPGGIAMGIDDAAGDVEAATQAAVEVSPNVKPTVTQGASSAGAPGGLGALAGATLTFILHGVSGAEDAEVRIRGVITDLIEGNVAALGEQVPNGS